MRVCTCGHVDQVHYWDGRLRSSCEHCLRCGQKKWPGKSCCLQPRRCKCLSFVRQEPVDRYTQDIEAGALG